MSRGSLVRLLALALIWGSGFYFIAIGLRGFSAVQLTFARLALGALVLVPIVLLREGHLPRGRRLWAHLTVAAFLANALPYTLFALAQDQISSGIAGVINATTPLWALIVEVAVGERHISRYRIGGLVLGFAGTLLIFAPWQSSGTVATWAGLAALTASASYGISYVYQHRYLTGHGHTPLALSAGQLIAATAILGALLPFNGRHTIHPRLDALVAVLILGAVITGAGYILNYRLVTDEGPAASIVSYLIPLVATTLGIAALGERPAASVLVGAVVVLTSIAFTAGK